MPSEGVYLMSPVLSFAAALRMALIGALFLGSPAPRWTTASPLSFRRAASSFSFSVGDSAIEPASLLTLMKVSTSNLQMRSIDCYGPLRRKMLQPWESVTFLLPVGGKNRGTNVRGNCDEFKHRKA